MGPAAPRVEPDLDLIHEHSRRPRLTWIGHASFLGQLGGCSFLLDPVFSSRVGLVYRYHGAPGLSLEQLPSLDAVMVTHNHYDHLDLPALRGLRDSVPVVAPQGLGGWLRRRLAHPIVELDWWQSIDLDRLRITLVPARHWSRRWVLDTNRSLWGGFVIEGGGEAVYHAGDSAWFDGFATIGNRFPGLLAAMLPIGGYEPAWFMEHNHLNPEQAGEAFRSVGARWLVPMHWGSIQLTDEPLCEPIHRLRRWWESAQLEPRRRLARLAVGETLLLAETEK